MYIRRVRPQPSRAGRSQARAKQIDPVEVWDLLKVLGLGGWGAGEESFLRYFEELRQPFDDLVEDHDEFVVRYESEKEGEGSGRRSHDVHDVCQHEQPRILRFPLFQ